MAKETRNDCCGCATPSYPCQGNSCPLRNATHYFCDRCGNETTLYEYDGEELCKECLIKCFEIVKGSDEQ